MPKKHKKPKLKEINPDKVGRGHSFGRVGRSSKFKSKKDYTRKPKKKEDLED